jgi:GTP-binding protein HflX
MAVLGELGAAAKPLINVYNKVDKLPHPEAVAFLARRPRSVVVSAHTGAGLDDLKHAMAETLKTVEDATAVVRDRSVDLRNERQRS